MNKLNLHFKNKEHLTALLNDTTFSLEIQYLNPERFDDYNLELIDPSEYHQELDTEEVILGKFARAIKRLIFSNSTYPIDYLNTILVYRKNGLTHNKQVIIDSTDFKLDN
ncbi:hypothetical protein RM553_05515 [Zunongwangia sp. F363]|uniref:Uncharacterized protein n=1 Tax=Autumnicola tepida TaxID=3075595 RepID=A0ABU3C7I7_9FLAO|nr:hypothetical protein [Zunongwangia sp. F363]MDT0642287.1 hypothetical protein [Zunongwangia sp. F363]